MNKGIVKFYNTEKGFGFIQPDNGEKDAFVHATALERAGINTLSEGQKVSFDIFDGVEKVTVVGRSIGKGFAGAMKRHNFAGLRASHGVLAKHVCPGTRHSSSDDDGHH